MFVPRKQILRMFHDEKQDEINPRSSIPMLFLNVYYIYLYLYTNLYGILYVFVYNVIFIYISTTFQL